MKTNNKYRLLTGLLVTAGALSACNSGSGGATGGGTSATASPLTAEASKGLFSASSCLTGSISVQSSSDIWYTSDSIIIKNSCSSAQDLSTQSVSFTSQDTAGKSVAVGTLNNWWYNNSAYTLTFAAGSGNQQVGTITSGNGSPSLPANSSITFTGGMNLNGAAYNSALATSSLAINGSSTPATTGTLNVVVDTTAAGCTGTTVCSGLTVNVNDASGTSAANFIIPAANLGGKYTVPVQNLTSGSTYSVSATPITSTTVSYTPTTATISATESKTITVKYTPSASVGSATVSLPTYLAAYTSPLQVKIINSALESSPVVNTYSVTQGSSFATGDLPVSDSKHVYKVVMTTGIANPATGVYYYESSIPTLTITKGSPATLSIPMVQVAATKLKNVTLVESGLIGSDTAVTTFSDSTSKYSYVNTAGIANGSVVYKVESGLLFGVSTQASGSNTYTTNPIVNTATINAAKTFTAAFVKQATPTPGNATVTGWPAYLAMGAIGGPNITTPTATSTGGDDDFGGKPIDAVFKYAGVNGNGDPGVIDPPMNALRMTKDLTAISSINKTPSRVVIVEYTGEMSGGENFSDFTNTNVPDANKQGATYIMARHFASLGADAMALADKPVVYNGKNYYGSLIMNPDLLGAMQQNNYTANVNNQLPAGSVNKAVDQALCLLTNVRTYTNNDTNSITDWSGQTPRKDSYGKTYTGTPYSILNQMLTDSFPAWIASSAGDQFWGVGIDNMIQGTKNYSQVGTWLNQCIAKPTYDTTKYVRPNFPAGFEGWVQANNWLIRTFAAKGTVTFGWQDNMWAASSGFWMHKDMTAAQIDSTYSTPVARWLASNAPSTIKNVGAAYAPDFFVFDRYEMDDSAAPGQATLYSARSWDNFLTAVGSVSKQFSNIPIMLWQIPGSHLPYTGEASPEYFNYTAGSYVFSTAPVYFFGDSNLKSDLSNLIMGTGAGTNNLVGNFVMAILSPSDITDGYHCPSGACANYQQYLKYYNGKTNNYDWSKDNGKLALAASNNVFAILWGGGNTTNVIKNFSNPDDHGWLANKIINYYKSPQSLK